MSLTYGSVCSGIEAASVAWKPLGWKAAFVSEIEAFPRAVLQHRHPGIPLHGDFTTIEAGRYEPVDLLVGGTPCQSFSVAGLRGGLDDERGNLALEYLRLADRLRPRWLVWENVPGVLSSNGGRDFGAILGGMVELGYGFAYRVLDAQFFGVAQRRRRVFVVGHFGDWRRAAAVLFERHGLSGDSAPRREAGEALAGTIGASVGDCSRDNIGESVIPILDGAKGRTDNRGSRDGSALGEPGDPMFTLREGSSHAIAFGWQNSSSQGDSVSEHVTPALDKSKTPAVFSIMPQNSGKDYKARQVEVAQPVMAGGPVGGNQGGDYIVQPTAFDLAQITSAANQSRMHVAASAVRRLTPRECERLQGFPDDYTLIPWRKGEAPDGPRYKALGNSMAVPVMAWIGRRIAEVAALGMAPQNINAGSGRPS